MLVCCPRYCWGWVRSSLPNWRLVPSPRGHPKFVSVAHLHAPTVSVTEQTAIISDRLRRSGTATFRSLTADCVLTVEIVARFLGLLELFRDGYVAFEQVTPLGDLLVRWTNQETPPVDATGGARIRPARCNAEQPESDDQPVVVLP